MLLYRNQIGVLVRRTLVLSSCLLAACATAIEADVDGPDPGASGDDTAGAGQSGVAGSRPVGFAGMTGKAGSGSGGATGVAGGKGVGGRGVGGSGGRGVGGSASGGRAAGGSGGRGVGGKGGGGATGVGGKGVGGTTGFGGKGGGGATGGTVGNSGTVIDLSTFQPVGAATYNGVSHTLTVVAQPFFQFPLPQAVATGKSVDVHVVGTNNGTAGLRSWLVNASQTTLSNVVTTYVGVGLPAGSFTLDYTLTATMSADLLFFKGAAVGTNIDSVTISSITVAY